MKFIPDDVAEYVEKYGYIPKYGWRSVFDREVVRSSPPKTPRIKTIAEFMPMGFRFVISFNFTIIGSHNSKCLLLLKYNIMLF